MPDTEGEHDDSLAMGIRKRTFRACEIALILRLLGSLGEAVQPGCDALAAEHLDLLVEFPGLH